jgi:hypothetical protein
MLRVELVFSGIFIASAFSTEHTEVSAWAPVQTPQMRSVKGPGVARIAATQDDLDAAPRRWVDIVLVDGSGPPWRRFVNFMNFWRREKQALSLFGGALTAFVRRSWNGPCLRRTPIVPAHVGAGVINGHGA